MKRIILWILLSAISPALFSQEEIIGNSYYDQQSNASCQNRIFVYNDGTIGTTWTFGMNPLSFSDRGTGYNYFDGTTWQPWPEERIESQRTGWPSYAQFGENGEIIIAHLSGASDVGLMISKRIIKGTGEWSESLFQGPAGHEEIFWPRMVTGGENHDYTFLMVMTEPVANGGLLYEGINGALLYSRSMDGGETWDIQNQILPGIDSSFYHEFTMDANAFAEPRDSIIAFVTGSWEHDCFLMKSTNFGETFQKTIIWDHPFDQGFITIPQDTFYCVDGCLDVALDNLGKAHVVFGITKTAYDSSDNQYSRMLWVDGLAYWNEDMLAFSNNLNALNPAGGEGSEMVTNHNLIAWCQDIDNNGQLDFTEEYGLYPAANGMTTMPQIVVDESNRIFVVYSSVTETFDNGIQNYRRLWIRSSLDCGNTWGQFYHYFPDDPQQQYLECVFTSFALGNDENLYLLYQSDIEPGLSIYGDFPYTENKYRFAKIPKDSIVGINQPDPVNGFDISQNFPNPFSQSAIVKVNLEKPAPLTLDVMNLLGQRVMQTQTIIGKQGVNHITIEKNSLMPGIYFYTVQSGEHTITKKMIIR
jgi:hypothetical protein